ncbi:MAG: hypothetical protein MMC33_009905 [Icmadophila ericetorum]|nr:hypothetical protein [Icmadophila ericetorum]
MAVAVSAQTQNLTALLTSQPTLSNLTSFVSLFPSLLSELASASNITILAPSNEAFSKFLNTTTISLNDTAAIQAILEYHVLNGTVYASEITSTPAFVHSLLSNTSYTNVTGGQVVEAVSSGGNVTIYSGLLSNASVTSANNNFTGGTVHIIDTVLTLPLNISFTAAAAGLTSAAGALSQAGLVDAVDGLSDVTLFAPSNAAFQAIGSALGNLTTSQLAGILEYHVVNGTVGYSSDLTNGQKLTALNGETLTITIDNGTVFVNSAQVVTPNVLVANGVVHVIDNVLNPNATTATPNPTATTQSVAFSGASSVSQVPFTSGVVVATTAPAASTIAGKATSTAGAYAPLRTGAIGAAALFAAGNAWINA